MGGFFKIKYDEISSDGDTLKNNVTTLFNCANKFEDQNEMDNTLEKYTKTHSKYIEKSIIKQELGLNNFTTFLLLGIYLQKKITYKRNNVCTSLFTKGLFVIANNLNNLNAICREQIKMNYDTAI